MQRKFIGNLIFILFLNLLVKPIWIGIDVQVQNRVPGDDYGLYYPIFSFAILLNILLDFGITNYNNRNIAQHGHMLKRYFSGIFNVKLILAGAYLVVILIAGLFIGYSSRGLWLLFILGINQVLSSMILYLRSNLSGLHLFKTEGILSIMDRSLMIVICSVLLWADYFGGRFEIEWFVYAQFWAYFVTGLVAFVLVLVKAQFFRIKIDWKLFRIILRESLPFALLVLLMSFYYRLDSVMIERMLEDGEKEAGIYAQAYRILEAFNMFGYLFAGLLLPIFSRMLKKKESVAQLVKTAFNLIFVPAVAAATVALLYPGEIMDWLYVKNAMASAEVFSVLMLSFIAIALTYIYGTLLTANGSLKQLNIISVIGLLLNLSFNAWLIPSYGAYGAAVATLVTQFFVILAQIIVAKQLLNMKYKPSFILKHTFLLLICCGVAYYSKNLFPNLIVHAVAIVALFGIAMFAFGLVKPKEVLQMIKNK